MGLVSDMKMPKPGEEAKESFRALVPPHPALTLRPMFGNLAAFVNGNMMAGLFGEDMFVRVAAPAQARIIEAGGRPFEPMAGRPMTGYTVVPDGWRTDRTRAAAWLEEALEFTAAMPAKAPKAAKPGRKKG